MQGAFFNLSEGEQVVREIKPEGSLRWLYFFSMLMPVGLPFFVMTAFMLFNGLGGTAKEVYGSTIYFAWIYALPAAILVFSWFLSGSQYSNEYYWITNKRVVYKRGTLGYRITSIPYERVSDVMISRTFIERIFGIAGLHIQSLSGQVTGPWQGAGLGAEGSLNAIPNPEETQEFIFRLIKEKRRDEHLTF